jgi:uncharacterized protein YbjT (DUF2867 family)
LKVVLFGATGMIGSGVLLECLDAAEVKSVLVVGRRACGVSHPKLKEVIVADLLKLDAVPLAGCDACFFCLGVSVVGMSEADYRRVTYDLTMAVARAVVAAAPMSVFVYVTGKNTDSTEQGPAMWARVKGKTENDLMRLGFRGAYMFRPGIIQPLRGVRSSTAWYQAFYDIFGPVLSLLRRLSPNLFLTSVDMGRAMINVAARGYPKPTLEIADIHAAART